MFTKIKAKVALLVLVPSIALSGMFQAVQGAESETATKAVSATTLVRTPDRTLNSPRDLSDAHSKLALVEGSVETREQVVPLAGKAVKVKPHSTYKEIENFSYDLGGNMPGGGI